MINQLVLFLFLLSSTFVSSYASAIFQQDDTCVLSSHPVIQRTSKTDTVAHISRLPDDFLEAAILQAHKITEIKNPRFLKIFKHLVKYRRFKKLESLLQLVPKLSDETPSVVYSPRRFLPSGHNLYHPLFLHRQIFNNSPEKESNILDKLTETACLQKFSAVMPFYLFLFDSRKALESFYLSIEGSFADIFQRAGINIKEVTYNREYWAREEYKNIDCYMMFYITYMLAYHNLTNPSEIEGFAKALNDSALIPLGATPYDISWIIAALVYSDTTEPAAIYHFSKALYSSRLFPANADHTEKTGIISRLCCSHLTDPEVMKAIDTIIPINAKPTEVYKVIEKVTECEELDSEIIQAIGTLIQALRELIPTELTVDIISQYISEIMKHKDINPKNIRYFAMAIKDSVLMPAEADPGDLSHIILILLYFNFISPELFIEVEALIPADTTSSDIINITHKHGEMHFEKLEALRKG